MKSQITGTTLSVTLQGNQINPAADGFIGEIKGICNLVITAKIDEVSLDKVFGIVVDGKKNVVVKKDLSHSSKQKVYAGKISVKRNDEMVFHTEYPNNNLRLLVVGENGNIQIWEIAIVSQAGRFFITQQKVWNTHCYNSYERVSCPLFEGDKGWPQMVEILKGLLSNQIDKLPSIEEKKEEDVNLAGTKVTRDKSGIVVWWNQAQGYGVIKTAKGVAIAHWSNISRPGSQRSYLLPNEQVNYKNLVPSRSTKGRPSVIPHQAIEISPAP
jgi:cold shock CspA family protein